jgi:glycosyltransferase involved in cell wall biosynthesis
MELTIAIPVFNGELFLEKCVTSILSQNIDVRILILDDASTDRTGLICKVLKLQNSCIDYIRFTENSGSPDKRIEEAINLCETQYFGWIGVDDYYNPNALLSFLNVLKSDSNVDYVFSDLETFGDLSLAPKGYGTFKNYSRFEYLSYFHETLLPIIPMNGIWKTSYLRSCNGSAWQAYAETHNRSDVLNGLFHFSNNMNVRHIPKKLISYRLHSSCGTQDMESRIFSIKGLLAHYYNIVPIQDLELLHKCDKDSLLESAFNHIKKHISKYSTYLQFSAAQGEIYFACMMFLQNLNPEDLLTGLKKRIQESV